METRRAEAEVLIEEIEGDVLTPISIFQKISGKKKFLLESSLKYENSGRYSFIGADPAFELKAFNGQVVLSNDNGEQNMEGQFLDVLNNLMPILDRDSEFPFIGGAVGYIGYDMIRDFENIGPAVEDQLDMPDAHLMFFEEAVVFDHLNQKAYLIAVPLSEEHTPEHLQAKLAKRKKELESIANTVKVDPFSISAYRSSVTQHEYEEMVKKAKDYIEQGDIFQVVLSRRLEAEAEGDPFSFYRKLRVQNPSPYMYYLEFENYVIAGASPESLVKARDGKITTNPIAGTRPRGSTENEDSLLQKELESDEKELAEHKMLVDLGRNDLGRVCEFGSVSLEKYMKTERYKHVMHLVSEVSGQLRDEYTPMDGLIACLPAGTVSGAPKIRAMQIISELEGMKRGVYSGAVGYLSANGSMDFALAIRTMVVKGGKAYIQAGAGIVYDSVPSKEYEETSHKLRSLREAQK
ncbi:anthranilate synthase component I [Mesobacillus harenae]|uniref:anthranilate synthase component I n=1 Tax=Mesobacillus harenae TaxID=2213203 RepID=UPI0030CB10E6